MKRFLICPDRTTPPASLPPHLHEMWRSVVRDWPLDKPWSVEAGIEEVVRKVEASHMPISTSLFD